VGAHNGTYLLSYVYQQISIKAMNPKRAWCTFQDSLQFFSLFALSLEVFPSSGAEEKAMHDIAPQSHPSKITSSVFPVPQDIAIVAFEIRRFKSWN
jgi:hypothetical protein